MTELYYPLRSLGEGHWFKLICGASFQDLPAVRNLTLAYTLAGADCIDVAADPAVIASALDALEVANTFGKAAQARGFGWGHRPLLMVSLNDGEDPHFRKAEFNPELCPADCLRPCEKICPAQAIVFQSTSHSKPSESSQISASPIPSVSIQSFTGEPNSSSPPCPQSEASKRQKSRLLDGFSGVIDQRCYGCGRCLPVCPSQLIYPRSYVFAPEAIAQLISPFNVDALEIHTKVGHFADFQRLWKAIAPWVNQLKLLAISCPDGEDLLEYLWALHDLITPLPCPLVWQTDGRPMSGDIGIGATRAAVKLSQKVLSAGLPGYVQLAGGTNAHTVMKLRAMGLLKGLKAGELKFENLDISPSNVQPANLQPSTQSYVAGVAYGSYARVLLSPILEKLEQFNGEVIDANAVSLQNSSLKHLEEFPSLLWQAVETAHSLVNQLKLSKPMPQPTPN
ncbi:MAG TPA: LdpA C-terminal domain-containing domain [Waterburya sp.]